MKKDLSDLPLLSAVRSAVSPPRGMGIDCSTDVDTGVSVVGGHLSVPANRY